MSCQITRYHCPEDEDTIKNIGKQANIQQAKNSGFQNIYPWKDQCEKEYHYVARDSSGIICGWLTAKLKTWKSQNYMLLSEISTVRIPNELFKGVGKRLHKAMLEDAEHLGMNFIYLYPLNNVVKQIYMKPDWGYISLHPNITYLFRILTKKPSKVLLQSMMTNVLN